MYLNRGFHVGLRAKFDKVFNQNLFNGESSRSGNGSSITETKNIQAEIPQLISSLRIKSILDIPCGDMEWMSKVDLSGATYIGADIAPSLIAHLRSRYPERRFEVINITKGKIPTVDLVFCRDLFVHLSNKDIRSAISNIKQSGSTFLATTTFIARKKNQDLPFLTRGVAWRTLNMELAPFNFPQPIATIDEKCTENEGVYFDKTIGLWKIADLL